MAYVAYPSRLVVEGEQGLTVSAFLAPPDLAPDGEFHVPWRVAMGADRRVYVPVEHRPLPRPLAMVRPSAEPADEGYSLLHFV